MRKLASANTAGMTIAGRTAFRSSAGASVSNGREGGIAFRFHARDVHLVLRTREQGASVPFQVLVDRKPPRDTQGLDVDEQGRGAVVQPRLYQLVRERGSIAERTFAIDFSEGGVEAYVFTFG